ncbi:MAG: hypothetical protein R3297_10740, partial [Desulfobulbales bacterium]|nr:hypothetical protein [Desulfobulbales bacterium]
MFLQFVVAFFLIFISTNALAAWGDQPCVELAERDLIPLQITELGVQTAALAAEAIGEAGQPFTNAATAIAAGAQAVSVGLQATLLGYEISIMDKPECATTFLGEINIQNFAGQGPGRLIAE